MQSTGSEVVHVAQRAFLVECGNPTFADTRCDSKYLEPGFYLALWPGCASAKQCAARARYLGPFPARVQAQFLALSALAIGLLQSVPST